MCLDIIDLMQIEILHKLTRLMRCRQVEKLEGLLRDAIGDNNRGEVFSTSLNGSQYQEFVTTKLKSESLVYV